MAELFKEYLHSVHRLLFILSRSHVSQEGFFGMITPTVDPFSTVKIVFLVIL